MSDYDDQIHLQDHPFHLVSPSPWPLYTSICLLNLTTTAALSMHSYHHAYIFWYLSLLLVGWSIAFWFRDVISEATFLGDHTYDVTEGLIMGLLLFIVSEVLFFQAIFWAYFHHALGPTMEVSYAWPPVGIQSVDPFELPLLNTVILLSSGFTITYAHHALILSLRKRALYFTLATLVLAFIFTGFQAIEYSVSSFTLSDGIFGSCFFFATGFHGLHVIIGTIFLGVSLWRIYSYHLAYDHNIGFETGIIYWHFVDVIWLYLYASIYYWNGG